MKKKSVEHGSEQGKKIEIRESGDDPRERALAGETPSDENLLLRVQEKEKEAAENYEKYLRAVADLDNYKKLAARERSDLIKYNNERMIKDLLPIMDNLGRALQHSTNTSGGGAFIEGVKMIYEQLFAGLEKYGVKRIDAVGQPFNPQLHEAMLLKENEDGEDGTVLQEFEKGYMLHDRLLRAAKVSVSKRKAGENRTDNKGIENKGG
jgi:molecular chaperone GrpE